MLLKVDCLPNAVGKQPSIPLIYLGRKWTLNWWWCMPPDIQYSILYSSLWQFTVIWNFFKISFYTLGAYFHLVCRLQGYWIPENGEQISVAIKVLKEGAQNCRELLDEARIMATVKHPCCIDILSVCLTKQMMLITSLMPLGCLLDYIRKHKFKISAVNMLTWSRQIAEVGWTAVFFFDTIFVLSQMYPENREGTRLISGSMNMGYDMYSTLPGLELATCSVPSACRFL